MNNSFIKLQVISYELWVEKKCYVVHFDREKIDQWLVKIGIKGKGFQSLERLQINQPDLAKITVPTEKDALTFLNKHLYA